MNRSDQASNRKDYNFWSLEVKQLVSIFYVSRCDTKFVIVLSRCILFKIHEATGSHQGLQRAPASGPESRGSRS